VVLKFVGNFMLLWLNPFLMMELYDGITFSYFTMYRLFVIAVSDITVQTQ
jgi:hypothetical protein